MDSLPHQCDHEPAAQYLITVNGYFHLISQPHPDFMFGSCGCSRRVAVYWSGIAAKHKENAALSFVIIPALTGRIADLPVNEPKPCN